MLMYPEEMKELEIKRRHDKYMNARKKKMRVFYVCGAYRAKTPRGIVENIRRAEAYAIKIWENGDVALCPHLNSRLMDGIVSDETFLKGAIELMKRCDGVVLVPGWENSKGAIREAKIACEIGLPVTIMGLT